MRAQNADADERSSKKRTDIGAGGVQMSACCCLFICSLFNGVTGSE
jgi:hypothetical protein